jgi:putative transposase
LIVARQFTGGSPTQSSPCPVGTPEPLATFPPWENEFAVRRFVDARDRITAYTEIVMPHTYVSDLVHCVFSTKLRRNLIRQEIQSDLWSFLGGIARKNKFKALMIGGTENHVHVLLSLPGDMPLAKAMQLIKGASSRWMNETYTKDFAWQEGYGAFTVGISQKADTIAYIQSQAEHHRKRSFEEEFIAFLKKHDVDCDPRYVWG